MKALRHPALWFAAFGAWFATLWWLSSQVREFPPALDFRLSDKVLHFGWFFGGAGLFAAALFRLDPTRPFLRRALLGVIVLTLVGISDELHQATVPGRDATFADLLADFLGACTGILVFERLKRVLE